MAEKKSTRIAYGEALVKLGAENDKVLVCDADLAHATMTAGFCEKYPDRFYNFGIAEADMDFWKTAKWPNTEPMTN